MTTKAKNKQIPGLSPEAARQIAATYLWLAAADADVLIDTSPLYDDLVTTIWEILGRDDTTFVHGASKNDHGTWLLWDDGESGLVLRHRVEGL